MCATESLQHGEANIAYLQRADAMRTAIGKANAYRKFTPTDSPIPQMGSVYDAAKKHDEDAFLAQYREKFSA